MFHTRKPDLRICPTMSLLLFWTDVLMHLIIVVLLEVHDSIHFKIACPTLATEVRCRTLLFISWIWLYMLLVGFSLYLQGKLYTWQIVVLSNQPQKFYSCYWSETENHGPNSSLILVLLSLCYYLLHTDNLLSRKIESEKRKRFYSIWRVCRNSWVDGRFCMIFNLVHSNICVFLKYSFP